MTVPDSIVHTFSKMAISDKRKLRTCVLISALLTIATVSCVCIFNGGGGWFKWGPQPTLVVAGVAIDTWGRYLFLSLFIIMNTGIDMALSEIGSPMITFLVYDPKSKHISDYSKNELAFLTSAFWSTKALRNIFTMLASITQIDFALMSLVVSETVGVFTVCHWLSTKTFGPVIEEDEDCLLTDVIAQ